MHYLENHQINLAKISIQLELRMIFDASLVKYNM